MPEPPPSLTGRVGVFGGSFNPPHLGHVMAVAYAQARWALDHVLILPSYQHPFGKKSLPFELRLGLLAETFHRADGRIRVSALERELGPPSYSVRVLEHLRAQHPAALLHFIIGSDLTTQIPTWYRGAELSQLAQLLIVPRGAQPDDSLAIPDISSSQLRTLLLAEPTPPAHTALAQQLPAAVLARLPELRAAYRAESREETGAPRA